MKLKSLRWGYDGGGFACGPVEGNSIVELTAVNDSGKLVFILASSSGEGVDFRISDIPLFDFMMNFQDEDVNLEEMFSMTEPHVIEGYGVLWGDEAPEEMFSSEYKDLLAISLASLQHYMNTPVDEEILPEDFLTNFINEYGEITDVPELSFEDDEEYDEDEY